MTEQKQRADMWLSMRETVSTEGLCLIPCAFPARLNPVLGPCSFQFYPNQKYHRVPMTVVLSFLHK